MLSRWVGAECSTFWVWKKNTACLTFWVRKRDNCFAAFPRRIAALLYITGIWSKIKRETPCPCFHMLPSFNNYFFPADWLCLDGNFHVSQEKRMFLPFWVLFALVWSSSWSSLRLHQGFDARTALGFVLFRFIVTARSDEILRLVSHPTLVIFRNNLRRQWDSLKPRYRRGELICTYGISVLLLLMR